MENRLLARLRQHKKLSVIARQREAVPVTFARVIRSEDSAESTTYTPPVCDNAQPITHQYNGAELTQPVLAEESAEYAIVQARNTPSHDPIWNRQSAEDWSQNGTTRASEGRSYFWAMVKNLMRPRLVRDQHAQTLTTFNANFHPTISDEQWAQFERLPYLDHVQTDAGDLGFAVIGGEEGVAAEQASVTTATSQASKADYPIQLARLPKATHHTRKKPFL